jgi:multidrug transporter EmrE-like cation transporter
MSAYLFALITLTITSVAQIVMRWRALEHGPGSGGDRWRYVLTMYTDPLVLACLGGAVVASVTYALALERLPLSVAYPMMALGFVVVPLLGRALFNDPLSKAQWLGMALIVAGVALTARS